MRLGIHGCLWSCERTRDDDRIRPWRSIQLPNQKDQVHRTSCQPVIGYMIFQSFIAYRSIVRMLNIIHICEDWLVRKSWDLNLGLLWPTNSKPDWRFIDWGLGLSLKRICDVLEVWPLCCSFTDLREVWYTPEVNDSQHEHMGHILPAVLQPWSKLVIHAGKILALWVFGILSSASETPWRTIWHKRIVLQFSNSCSVFVLRRKRTLLWVLQAKPAWLPYWGCSSAWTPSNLSARTRRFVWRTRALVWNFATLPALAASSSVARSNLSHYNNLWAPKKSSSSSPSGMNTYDFL